MPRECIECGETKNLETHPEYIGDAMCLQCLHGWYLEKREEMHAEVMDIEEKLTKKGLNFEPWENL